MNLQKGAKVKDFIRLLIYRLVDTYLKGLEIEEHRKKMSKDCSGGTKRKLSYIISMLGKHHILYILQEKIPHEDLCNDVGKVYSFKG